MGRGIRVCPYDDESANPRLPQVSQVRDDRRRNRGKSPEIDQFNAHHAFHSLITTAYNEIDNLECGKIRCEDDDKRRPLHYVKDVVQDV